MNYQTKQLNYLDMLLKRLNLEASRVRKDISNIEQCRDEEEVAYRYPTINQPLLSRARDLRSDLIDLECKIEHETTREDHSFVRSQSEGGYEKP